MKTRILLLAGMSLLSFAACKKEDASPAPAGPSPAEGFWQGTYSRTGFLGNEKMALLVKPGGGLRYYEMNGETDTASLPELAKVSGTWVFDGSELKISYLSASKTYNASLEMNAAKTQLAGPWSLAAAVKGNMILNR
ncbi:MAG: hypothetical protein H7Y86_14180 [Rhizobacter sp.]|nr:hypothetical protein [Ferruginibacter sp.]